MTDSDYLAFRERLLLAIADAQPVNGPIQIVDLHEITASWTPVPFPTWLMTVGSDMESLGWGKAINMLDGNSFVIDGPGLAEAARIRRKGRESRGLGLVPRFLRDNGSWFWPMIVSAVVAILVAWFFG